MPAMASTRAPAADVGLLMDLSRALVAVAVRSLGAIDGAVPLPQFRALTVLERVGPINASFLAGAVGLHVSSITRLCDRLVEADLITREISPDSRREVELRVTPAGSKLVHQVRRARSKELSRVLQSLSAGQRAALRDAIPPVLDVLAGAAPDVGWG